MKRLPSIRQRLLRVLLKVSLAWVLAATGAVWFAVHHEVDEHLDAAIQESAEILYGLLSYEAAPMPAMNGGSLPAPPHDERLVWQLVDARHVVVMRSHRAPATPLAARPHSVGFSDAPGGWRVYGMALPARGQTLYVAQTGAERQEAQLESGLTMVGGALVIGLLCVVWLGRRVRNELRPLQQLSEAVAAYDPLRSGATLEPVLREELEPMRHAILDLGDRLMLHIDAERAFTAHAAHALRTPIAGMSAQLAVALRECPPDLQPRLQRARAASERLGKVVSALLALFRSGVQPQPQPVELHALVASLPTSQIRLEVADASDRFEADPDLLSAALMNLVDNAERHGATRLAIAARRGTDAVVLRLHDDGPGARSGQIQAMSAALASQRYDGDSGLGLGLMLVDIVARAHHGRLRIGEAGQGFAVEITLAQTRRPQVGEEEPLHPSPSPNR